MSLAAQLSTDMSTVFLNTDDYGETLRYFPQDAAARDIVAVRVPLSRYRRQRERRIDEEAHHKFEANELAFLVSRDATAGMENPRLGDAIRLATDEDGERWDFVSIEQSTPVSYVVAWQKKRTLSQGHSRPARL